MPDRCAQPSFDNIHLEVLSFLVRLRVLHKREKEKLFYFMYHPAEALELVFSIRGPHYPNLGPLKLMWHVFQNSIIQRLIFLKVSCAVITRHLYLNEIYIFIPFLIIQSG